MKAHGLLEGDEKRYAYRLTRSDVKAALLFVLLRTATLWAYRQQPLSAPTPS